MFDFVAPFPMLLSGHGNPMAFQSDQDTYPITVICLGAAALIAVLWALAEFLDWRRYRR